MFAPNLANIRLDCLPRFATSVRKLKQKACKTQDRIEQFDRLLHSISTNHRVLSHPLSNQMGGGGKQCVSFFFFGGEVGQPTHSLLAYVEERRTSSSSSYLTSTESHACCFRPPTFLFFFFFFSPPLQASLLVYCWGRTALCRWGKMPLQLLEVW